MRDGDSYVVNGQKIWTSRVEHSDLMLLLARTTPREQAAKRTDGLSVFLQTVDPSDGFDETFELHMFSPTEYIFGPATN